MAYLYPRPIHIAVERHWLDAVEYARTHSHPYLFWNPADGIWYLRAADGGAGANPIPLAVDDPTNSTEAIAEARGTLDPDGTNPA